MYYRLSDTREGGEGENKIERVSATAHTHKPQGAFCSRIAQVVIKLPTDTKPSPLESPHRHTFRYGRAQPPRRDRLGFPENFEAQGLRAHVARKARTPAHRPKGTPLTSPRSFVSPRHKSRGDPRFRTRLQSGQAIVREGAELPVIKVYIH